MKYSTWKIHDQRQNQNQRAAGAIQQLRYTFSDPPSPHHHALSRLFTRILFLHYSTLSRNIPPLFPNKKTKFQDLRKIGVEAKKSLSSFMWFFFLHLKTPFFKSMSSNHIPSTFEYKFEHMNTIRNSNITIRI